MGLIDRFLKQYLQEETGTTQEPTATAAELAELLDALKKANGDLRCGQLTEAQRLVMRGKTSPLLTSMLAAAVRGLQGAPRFATSMGAEPETVLQLLEQRMALTGAAKTLEMLKGRADGCWYWVAERAQQQAQRLVDVVAAALGPEHTRTPRQMKLGGHFAQALRSHEASTQKKGAAAEAVAGQREADAQALAARKDQVRLREAVGQMMAEIAEGKGLLPVARDKDQRDPNKDKERR